MNINLKTLNGEIYPVHIPLDETLGNLINYIDDKFSESREITNVVYLGFSYDMKKYSSVKMLDTGIKNDSSVYLIFNRKLITKAPVKKVTIVQNESSDEDDSVIEETFEKPIKKPVSKVYHGKVTIPVDYSSEEEIKYQISKVHHEKVTSVHNELSDEDDSDNDSDDDEIPVPKTIKKSVVITKSMKYASDEPSSSSENEEVAPAASPSMPPLVSSDVSSDENEKVAPASSPSMPKLVVSSMPVYGMNKTMNKNNVWTMNDDWGITQIMDTLGDYDVDKITQIYKLNKKNIPATINALLDATSV